MHHLIIIQYISQRGRNNVEISRQHGRRQLRNQKITPCHLHRQRPLDSLWQIRSSPHHYQTKQKWQWQQIIEITPCLSLRRFPPQRLRHTRLDVSIALQHSAQTAHYFHQRDILGQHEFNQSTPRIPPMHTRRCRWGRRRIRTTRRSRATLHGSGGSQPMCVTR